MRALRLGLLIVWCGLFAATASAIDLDKITFNGYTSFEFEKQLERKASGKGDSNGSFDADTISLIFNFQASDKVRTAVDVTYEHGVATEDSRGNVALEFGFVEYTVSDALRIRGGKFLQPFGVFNEIHDAKPAFLPVREAASTTKPSRIISGARILYPRWGSGIEIQGDAQPRGQTRIDYALLISNGDQNTDNGENPFENDDNTFKSVTARVRIEPRDELRIGTSVYYDRFANGASAPYGTGFESVHSHGLEAEWLGKRFHLLGEAVYGVFEGRPGRASVKQLGGYLQPSWHFSDRLAVYGRYDAVNADRDVSGKNGAIILAGVNVEISKMIFKIEMDHFRGGRGSDYVKFPGRDYNELKMAVTVGF